MKIANAYEVSGRDIILALRVDPVRVRLAKSTRFPGRLPVFQHFYPSTRFLIFLPVFGIQISKQNCIFTDKYRRNS